jgi:hypothetical protein
VKRAFLGAALAALVVCSAAAAHGGGGALGFRSTVTGETPAVAGLQITVLDYDDRLELNNDTGKPLIILGYQGEPYLAFRDGKVYRNTKSPASYLNDDRFGQVDLPAQADAKAPPAWEEIGQRETYDWHDHRIHWMSRTLPPRIEAAKAQPQHVFDWTVPAMLDGRPLRITGSLDYSPPPSGKPTLLIGVLVVMVVAGVAAVVLRLHRERRSASVR